MRNVWHKNNVQKDQRDRKKSDFPVPIGFPLAPNKGQPSYWTAPHIPTD